MLQVSSDFALGLRYLSNKLSQQKTLLSHVNNEHLFVQRAARGHNITAVILTGIVPQMI